MNETSQVTQGLTVPFFFPLLPLINIVLAVLATLRCVRTGHRGLALILWLLFIWLVPIIGSLVALFVVRRRVATGSPQL